MNLKNNEHFDPQPNEQFSKDLKALFEPAQKVRPEVDRAVMDQAAARLHRRGNRRRLMYWPGYVAAAAVVIVAGVLWLDFNKPVQTLTPVAKNDINRDGTVDILDAYKLARYIKSAGLTDPQWDFNGDGIVDQRDVDTVAMGAVKLNEGVL